MEPTPVVTDNPDRSRFQGAGLAGELAKASLDDARARHLAVVPTCPYIRSWIDRHPGYADLVAIDGESGAHRE